MDVLRFSDDFFVGAHSIEDAVPGSTDGDRFPFSHRNGLA
jgi:hypothetical protein